MPGKVLASNERPVRETNGKPGWRDVLNAVETSEERVMKKIDHIEEKVEDIDRRTERLEDDMVRRESRGTAYMSVVGGVKGLFLVVIAAFGAVLGFLGFMA